MRQKLIKILYISIILFAISCQYDTESSTPTQVQSEKKFTVKKLKFDEIVKNNALFDKVREFNKGKKIESNINGKIVYSTENDFYIDTNIATYIEDENGKISYTFKVFRNDSPYLLENIVLTHNDSLGFDLYFAQYDITQQEVDQLKSGEAVNTSEKTMVFKITDNSFTNNLFNKAIMIDIGSGSCIIGQSFILGSLCGCDQHVYGASCTCPIQATPDQWITTWGSCPTEGGGGGSGGGGNPSNNNNFPTTPTFEEFIFEESPCDKIKDGTSSLEYKQKFKALTNNYDAATETGFSLVGNNYVNGTAVGSTSIMVSINSKNMTHVHNNKPKFYENTTIPYDGAIKILSTGDITDVLIPMQSNNTNPTDTFVAMLSNEGIYSISILEPITWTTDLAIKFEEFENDYKNFSQYIVDNYTTMNVDDRKDYLEKYFLLALKRIGLENKIGLFEGEVENVNSTDINNYNIKWTRKKLRKVFLGYKVDPEPCN